MRIIQDDLWLCADCTLVACNGTHGIELTDPDATIKGLAMLGPHLVPDFDSNTLDSPERGIDEFSSAPCEACKTRLAGHRARFATLGD